MARPIVSVDKLVKHYGDTKAVDAISFNIYPGEIFALLGPNGAGKTTTLECIEGIRRPDNGSILVAGADPERKLEKIRKILGIQLQASSLPDIITVEEAMKMFCLYLGVEPRYDLLEKLDLRGKYNTQFDMLSTGQQRKLVLVIALAHNPSIIILDEPTAGLDVNTRVELHNIMREEREKGVAILLASHDMAEVEELADRAAILLNGKIVVAGTPNEIVTSGDRQVKIHIKTLNDSIIELESAHILQTERREGYSIYLCKEIEELLEDILAHIKFKGDKLIDLRVERPSLEERFIDITTNGKQEVDYEGNS